MKFSFGLTLCILLFAATVVARDVPGHECNEEMKEKPAVETIESAEHVETGKSFVKDFEPRDDRFVVIYSNDDAQSRHAKTGKSSAKRCSCVYLN
ncbi:hypothetical protein V6N13_057867 [Hibiscus sabdariffa]|uniref:Uncharacterized protein n=1 Tax=Hibiscus sabdariffa TaxID=183260 RepID=A0ABR2GHY9_9ROSI